MIYFYFKVLIIIFIYFIKRIIKGLERLIIIITNNGLTYIILKIVKSSSYNSSIIIKNKI